MLFTNNISSFQLVQAIFDRLGVVPVIPGREESLSFLLDVYEYGMVVGSEEELRLLASAENKDDILRVAQATSGSLLFPKRTLFGENYTSIARNEIFAVALTFAHYASTYGVGRMLGIAEDDLHSILGSDADLPVFEGLAKDSNILKYVEKARSVKVMDFSRALELYLRNLLTDKVLTTTDKAALDKISSIEFRQPIEINQLNNYKVVEDYPEILSKVSILDVTVPVIRHLIKSINNPRRIAAIDSLKVADMLLDKINFYTFVSEYLQHQKLYRSFFAIVESIMRRECLQFTSDAFKYFTVQRNRETAYFKFRPLRGKYSKLEKAIKKGDINYLSTVEPNLILLNLTSLLRSNTFDVDELLQIILSAAKKATPVMLVRAYNALVDGVSAHIVFHKGELRDVGSYKDIDYKLLKAVRSILIATYTERFKNFLRDTYGTAAVSLQNKNILDYAVPSKRVGDGKTLYPPLGSVLKWYVPITPQETPYVSVAIEWKDNDQRCTDFDLHTIMVLREKHETSGRVVHLGWDSQYYSGALRDAGVYSADFSGDMTCAKDGAVEIQSLQLNPMEMRYENIISVLPLVNRYSGAYEEYVNAIVAISDEPLTKTEDLGKVLVRFALPDTNDEAPLAHFAVPGVLNIQPIIDENDNDLLEIEFISLTGVSLAARKPSKIIAYSDIVKQSMKVGNVLDGLDADVNGVDNSTLFKAMWEFTFGVDTHQ